MLGERAVLLVEVRTQHQNCFALLKAFNNAARLLQPLAVATPSFVKIGRPANTHLSLIHI